LEREELRHESWRSEYRHTSLQTKWFYSVWHNGGASDGSNDSQQYVAWGYLCACVFFLERGNRDSPEIS
jgi:hypothetical protein